MFKPSRKVYTNILCFFLGVLCNIVVLRAIQPPVAEAEEPIPTAVVTVAASTSIVDADAECVARVLYGVREYGLSDTAKTAIIEVIMNRVADTACEFRTIDNIKEACEQANQWQGYVPDGTYLLSDYELALNVLNSESNAKTIPDGCFFLVVKQGEVTARTKWDGGNEWKVS